MKEKNIDEKIRTLLFPIELLDLRLKVKKMNFIKKFIRHSKNTIKMTKTKKFNQKKSLI